MRKRYDFTAKEQADILDPLDPVDEYINKAVSKKESMDEEEEILDSFRSRPIRKKY